VLNVLPEKDFPARATVDFRMFTTIFLKADQNNAGANQLNHGV